MHIIRLKSSTGRVYFLHSMRRDRITKTRNPYNARRFDTAEQAQDFLNTHAMFFGYRWEIMKAGGN